MILFLMKKIKFLILNVIVKIVIQLSILKRLKLYFDINSKENKSIEQLLNEIQKHLIFRKNGDNPVKSIYQSNK